MFDQDGSGNIGADEIKKVLNLGKDKKVDQKLQEIIAKID
jgi:Ca2+-binding EF-hand superfamily protein